MNKRGQVIILLVIVALVIILTALAFIEPWKEVLNTVLGSEGLDCADSTNPLLTHKLPCWVLSGSMVWAIGYVIWTAGSWVWRMWRKKE